VYINLGPHLTNELHYGACNDAAFVYLITSWFSPFFCMKWKSPQSLSNLELVSLLMRFEIYL
jgi:hypothetical protein